MIPPRGACVFHNGTPIELLHRLGSTPAGEVWRCRPLFVDDQTLKDFFLRNGDTFTPLHTTRLPL